jgi:cytochrome o ubiquinol oxidase subunit 1
MLAFAFRDEEDIEVPAEQIARFEQVHQAEIAV